MSATSVDPQVAVGPGSRGPLAEREHGGRGRGAQVGVAASASRGWADVARDRGPVGAGARRPPGGVLMGNFVFPSPLVLSARASGPAAKQRTKGQDNKGERSPDGGAGRERRGRRSPRARRACWGRRGLGSGSQNRGVFLPPLRGDETLGCDIGGDVTGRKQGVFKEKQANRW